MNEFLKRGRGDNKTYINNKRSSPTDNIIPVTNEDQLVLGSGKGRKVYPKKECPNCKLNFLEASLEYHLKRCK